MNKHFTASAVVLHREYVLMVHHPRLKSWVPPGGHIEPDELPDKAAVREVLEETGVAVDVISDDVPYTGDNEVFVLKQPLCMHQVKAFEKDEHVYHVDIVYLCRPKLEKQDSMPQVIPGDGIAEAKWVKLDELNSLKLAPNVIEVVEMGYSKLRCKNATLRP